MNIEQAIYLLMNKAKSWEPKHVDRPLSANQTSNWEWIAPKNGTLYLVFTTYERSYSTVHYNNSSSIATVAVPGATSPTVVTVPIRVKKGDKINVNNLNDKCYLSKSETSFIRGGGITLAISTLSALLEGWWKHEYQTNAICTLAKDNKGRKLSYNTNSCVWSWNCALGQGGTNHSYKCEQSSSREYSNNNITRKVQTILQCTHLYIRPEPNKKNTIKYNNTRGAWIVQLWECYNRKYKRFSDNHLHSNADCLTVRGCVA